MSQSQIIKRIAISIVVSVLIFSSSSFILAAPVYIAIPIFAAFIITFILEERELSAITSPIIVSVSCLIFAHPPPKSPGNTPDAILQNLVFERQLAMLSYSPLLLVGILGGVLGWGLATILKDRSKWLSYFTIFLFIIICVNFVWISLDLNPEAIRMASEEPQEGAYNNYNSLNLKTFYLMKRGLGFYDAYSRAFSGKADTPGINPGNLWNWRLPTVYYLWQWLLPSDGFYIFYLYLIMSIITFYFAFNIACQYLKSPLCLIGPVLLAPFFVYGAAGFWYTFPEYWGVFFMIMGIWGIIRKNDIAVVAGFTLALLIRSFFLISWVGVAAITLTRKEKKSAILVLIPGVIFAFAYVAHYQIVMGMSGAEVPPWSAWLKGNFAHLWVTLQFGSALVSRATVTVLLLILMLVASIIVHCKDRSFLTLAVCAIFPMATFLIMGPETYRAYWGIIFIPFLMLGAIPALGIAGDKKK